MSLRYKPEDFDTRLTKCMSVRVNKKVKGVTKYTVIARRRNPDGTLGREYSLSRAYATGELNTPILDICRVIDDQPPEIKP